MATMTHRERFLNRINGKPVDRTPFFPDLTKWYEYMRYGDGERPRSFLPGGIIWPDEPLHAKPGIMPERYRDLDFLGVHRAIDCGMPVHGYHIFFNTHVDESVQFAKEQADRQITTTVTTPVGNLREVRTLNATHNWTVTEHMVKSHDDFKVIEHMTAHTTYAPDYEPVERALEMIGEQGYLNLIIPRSPMGRMIHNFAGLLPMTYAIADAPGAVRKLLEAITEKDRELWKIAAEAPGKIAFMADNMDEFLISPVWYRDYFLPVYQEMNDVLHAGGKKVLTHMDGRLKNIFPMIPDSGFDVLDGCCPAPMCDYQPKELAAALGEGQTAYCGVPASYFIRGASHEKILDFAKKILDEMGERVILNVADVLPAEADIETVEKMAELVKSYG